MANNIFRDHYKRAIKAAVEKAKSAKLADHSGLEGQIREVVVDELLRPMLPPSVAIGTGKLTDADGNLSQQSDVVIYYSGILPPVMIDAKLGFFPVESCLCCIEVKTKLSAADVRDAVEKARSIRGLNYLPTVDQLKGTITPHGPRVVNVLFAFGTDLSESGKSEIERYVEIDPGTDPLIPVLCVQGRGYWFYKHTESRWVPRTITDNHEEMLDFLGNLANTIPKLLQLKGCPSFARYLVTG